MMWISEERWRRLNQRVNELEKNSDICAYGDHLYCSGLYKKQAIPLNEIVLIIANHLGLRVTPEQPQKLEFIKRKQHGN